ncbi:MAG: hypothetical protein VKI83_05615, partial [Synechococcaceae cyanobacterium]|nr:hypothetical protein [Synechococcaceae cyanobacterium]
MKKSIFALLILASLGIIGLGFIRQFNKASEAKQSHEQARIARKNGLNVSALGTIEPISEVHALSGPMRQFGGTPRISAILVAEGQKVDKGQVLVQFDNFTEADSERFRINANIRRKNHEIRILESQTMRFKQLAQSGAYAASDLEEKKARLASYYSQLEELQGSLRSL